MNWLNLGESKTPARDRSREGRTGNDPSPPASRTPPCWGISRHVQDDPGCHARIGYITDMQLPTGPVWTPDPLEHWDLHFSVL